MSADNLIHIGCEIEVADLRASVNASDLGACESVPELDASICRASA